LSRPPRPIVPIAILAGVVGGATGAAYFAGVALAYVSLFFGVLFFLYAARYYVASISVLLAPSVTSANGKNGGNGQKEGNGGVPALPMISVHLAVYNEERVVDRLLVACSKLDYPNYEVVVVDDSNDGTVSLLKEWILRQLESAKPKFKIIHRDNRKGFKGGALNEALKHTDPRAEYVVVLDADFVPDPGLLRKFIGYFNLHGPNGNGNGGTRYADGKLAAVQGYQWHTLNRTENWLTRGVSCEFSGSYMVDRTFQEVAGTMKMVAGSVYMIRADLLKKYGWSESITEDWELTLRMYEEGYKVLYTPLIQAPAECPSTLGKLIRQRMRWAEGHTFNVKKHFLSVLRSRKIGVREKLEFLYFAPYYLQSLFLIIGTFFWFTSDIVLGAKLPFLTAEFGWALVLTNLLALPFMSLAGLFLERRARKDFGGVASQLVLIYALSPYQAYASLKGLVEPAEGSWIRTFKSGKVAGFPGRLEPRKVIRKMLPPRKSGHLTPKTTAVVASIVVLSLVLFLFAQGQLHPKSTDPAYYFNNQTAPASYAPFSSTPAGVSFLMQLAPPSGPETNVSIGTSQGSGPIFFSEPAPKDIQLPYGASVSFQIWVDTPKSSVGYGGQGCKCDGNQSWVCPEDGNQGCNELKFDMEVYDPSTNSISQIEGVNQVQAVALKPGLNEYQMSYGNIGENQVLKQGDTILATVWCPSCKAEPVLLFNSYSYPSNIDFPIEVPENSLSVVGLAILTPGIAGLVIEYMKANSRDPEEGSEDSGFRRVQRWIIVAGALAFLTLPLAITFNDLIANLVSSLGLSRLVSSIVPYEAGTVASVLRGIGLQAGNNANTVWISGGFIPVTTLIDWNCAGWQGFVLFGITAIPGLGDVPRATSKALVVLVGVLGIFAVNVLRILLVVLLGYYVSYPAALIFHDYGGTLMTLGWLLVFWFFVLSRWGDKGEDMVQSDDPVQRLESMKTVSGQLSGKGDNTEAAANQ
jgi:exosortase/archaeosortase family protein